MCFTYVDRGVGVAISHDQALQGTLSAFVSISLARRMAKSSWFSPWLEHTDTSERIRKQDMGRSQYPCPALFH
jgi:hypothetical protein